MLVVVAMFLLTNKRLPPCNKEEGDVRYGLELGSGIKFFACVDKLTFDDLIFEIPDCARDDEVRVPVREYDAIVFQCHLKPENFTQPFQIGGIGSKAPYKPQLVRYSNFLS